MLQAEKSNQSPHQKGEVLAIFKGGLGIQPLQGPKQLCRAKEWPRATLGEIRMITGSIARLMAERKSDLEHPLKTKDRWQNRWRNWDMSLWTTTTRQETLDGQKLPYPWNAKHFTIGSSLLQPCLHLFCLHFLCIRCL